MAAVAAVGAAAVPAASAGSDEETNVRVAARVRPLLAREKAANCSVCVTVDQGTRQVVVGSRRTFAFDLVFDGSSTQDEVYEGCVAPLLDGCTQGYNATILAYGQTSSGKTHTMGTGHVVGAESSEEEGITPKVIRNSFEYLERHRDEMISQVSCCYIEIYNEEIRDLLQPSTHKSHILVRERSDGVIQLAGVHASVCASASEMLRCLADGSVQRTTGATLMNEQSSRSHSIFTLILEQRRRRPRSDGSGEEATYRTAKFHLVDLAGSERNKRTGAVGTRFKESMAINAGLLALGNVISALGDPAKRGGHVPYRESKLTRLLQDSLGGNSRTLMIACASGADSDFEETLNTLKYAHRARNIKNKPVVNHDPQVAQRAALLDENEALRRELQRFAEHGSPRAGLQPEGAVAAAEARLVAERLGVAEARCEVLAERLTISEGECDTARRSLADVYGAVCHHLPAIWQASEGAGEAAGPGCARGGRQALAAVCEALQAARRVLGAAATAPEGDDAAAESGERALRCLAACREASCSGDAFLEQATDAADESTSLTEDMGRLRTLTEMRRDSTLLIRKYLDEMQRLEAEVALYRKRTRQLEEELRQTKDDLLKDEDIFDEKCAELRGLVEQNEELRLELWEAQQAAAAAAVSCERRPGSSCRPSSSELFADGRLEESDGTLPDFGGQSADDVVRLDLLDSRSEQGRLELELNTLAQNVTVKEELIRDLEHSEREWSETKAQYQKRMEQLQGDLYRMQNELRALQDQLAESEHLKEEKRQMEEEKRALENRIMDQVDCIRKKQQEFFRLKELRHQDNRKIKELETEVQQLRGTQRELDRRLQTEHKREATQVSELQRRLQRQGQRVRDLEAENLRHRETLKRQVRADPGRGDAGRGQRQRSATPLRRHSSSSNMAVAAEASGSSWAAPRIPATSSTARVQTLERQIDDYVKSRQDIPAQGLEEDQRKLEDRRKKLEQYNRLRQQMLAKVAAEQNTQPAYDNVESLLREIDERMESLQDEIDYREARLAEQRQELRPGGTAAGGPPPFDAEFSGATLDDAKAVLERCCEKLIRSRQREKQHGTRLAAVDAQLHDKCRRVEELETSLRRHDSNQKKAIAEETKKYQEQIRALLQHLSSAQQAPVELDLQRSLVLDRGGALQPVSAAATPAAAAAALAAGATEMEAELERLRMDNQFFQAQNRELKRKLRAERERSTIANESQLSVSIASSARATDTSAARCQELAEQVEKLASEKELLREENELVRTQLVNLKQYQYRFHNISSVSVARSDLVPRSPPAAPSAALLPAAAPPSAASQAVSPAGPPAAAGGSPRSKLAARPQVPPPASSLLGAPVAANGWSPASRRRPSATATDSAVGGIFAAIAGGGGQP